MNGYEDKINNTPLKSRSRNGMMISSIRALALCLIFLIYAALSMDLMTNAQGLVAYTLVMLFYLYLEANNLWKRDPHLFWLNPVVLASIFTFVTAFGLSNILYFLPEDMLVSVGLLPIVTPWMNQLMFLVMLGAISMWIGYSTSLGRNIGRKLNKSRFFKRWILPSLRVKKSIVYSFLAVSILAKLLAIKLGIFGYSSTYDQLIEASNYTQYFYIADMLGKAALVGVALEYFSLNKSTAKNWKLLVLILGNEVFFGIISGFKSSVVIPFIILGMAYYSQRSKFPRWLIPVLVIGLMVAYAVIEPFRQARYGDAGFTGTSLGSIVSTMRGASTVKSIDSGNKASTTISILARSNMTYIGSLGIEYAAYNKNLPEGSPEFLKDIFLAPVNAVIPRVLWGSKSLQNIGLWYTNEVIGHEYSSSTGMTPFTYLNFAGGPLAVIVGFFLVGIFQRGIFDGLRNFGGGGLIILLGLLATLSNIDSAFNSFFIGVVRLMPILVIFQFVLLKRVRS